MKEKKPYAAITEVIVTPPPTSDDYWWAVAVKFDGERKTAHGTTMYEAVGRAVVSIVPSPVVIEQSAPDL